MMKQQRRHKRPLQRTDCTNVQMAHILPKVLGSISAKFRERPDLVLEAWPQVIGEKLAPMTRAASFDRGVLSVLVSNSSLYSLLAGPEKRKLLESLRKMFPRVEIKNIQFKLG